MVRPGGVALVVAVVLVACGGETSPPTSPSIQDSPSPDPSTPASSAEPEPPAPSGQASAFAGAWADVTSDEMSSVGAWTNKVELADLDVDGDVDILFANGGDYDA